MFGQDKVAAVCGYLEEAFPGCKIRVDDDPGSNGRGFQIIHQGSTYHAVISDEFFESHDLSELVSKLKGFTLAEHLRDLPGTPVLVTRAGLRLAYE